MSQIGTMPQSPFVIISDMKIQRGNKTVIFQHGYAIHDAGKPAL